MMREFARVRQRPECQCCGKAIEEDFCVVTDEENEFNSCICLDCRDRLQSRIRKESLLWVELLMPVVDGKERETPCQEYDIIPTVFAKLCG